MSAESRLLQDRSRFACWLLDRLEVVGSRRPILCVGGKEKWFARLNARRETREHVASLEACMSGLLVIHLVAIRGLAARSRSLTTLLPDVIPLLP